MKYIWVVAYRPDAERPEFKWDSIHETEERAQARREELAWNSRHSKKYIDLQVARMEKVKDASILSKSEILALIVCTGFILWLVCRHL